MIKKRNSKSFISSTGTCDAAYTWVLIKINALIIEGFIIPPVYEVFRGYIVFAFSVCLCVCVFTFFLSKISQELLDRILKFCTHIRYDKLYYV